MSNFQFSKLKISSIFSVPRFLSFRCDFLRVIVLGIRLRLELSRCIDLNQRRPTFGSKAFLASPVSSVRRRSVLVELKAIANQHQVAFFVAAVLN